MQNKKKNSVKDVENLQKVFKMLSKSFPQTLIKLDKLLQKHNGG